MRTLVHTRRVATIGAALLFTLTPAVGYAAADDTSVAEPSGVVDTLATDCNSDGTTGQPWARCTKLDNGVLIHWKKTYDTGTKAHTTYEKTDGGRVTLRLGYSRNGNEHWSSYFTQTRGQTKQKSWSFGDRNQECKASIGLLQERGSDKRQTPIQKC
ncbi:hypothetical protein [Streptomyces torulosus]|uniref:hypothetical protein n=1 Tax=Streptomyces torulosus TaxID=68276 RepID=UPI0006EBDF99|nr:hypothetical protein [Streptomyces torulosus]